MGRVLLLYHLGSSFNLQKMGNRKRKRRSVDHVKKAGFFWRENSASRVMCLCLRILHVMFYDCIVVIFMNKWCECTCCNNWRMYRRTLCGIAFIISNCICVLIIYVKCEIDVYNRAYVLFSLLILLINFNTDVLPWRTCFVEIHVQTENLICSINSLSALYNYRYFDVWNSLYVVFVIFIHLFIGIYGSYFILFLIEFQSVDCS